MIGNGIFVDWASGVVSAVSKIASAFIKRVIADGGTVESKACLETDLTYLTKYPISSSFDTDYQSVLNRAGVLGFTIPSASQQTLQNRLVKTLKTFGVWNKLDVFYMFATNGDSDFATLNWKAPSSFQTTKVNSPTFTTDAGFSGNGSTAYLDTNFVISTDVQNYSQNNASTFTYFESDLSQSDFVAYGVRDDIDPVKCRNQLRMRATDYRPSLNDQRRVTGTDFRSNKWHHQKRTSSTGFTTFLDNPGATFANTIASTNPSGLDFSMRLLTLHFKDATGLSNLFGSAKGKIKSFGIGEALDNTALKNAINSYLTAI